jgi:HK97 family phage major capsid protein
MSKTELQEKRGRLVTQAREALDEIKKNTDEARRRNSTPATTQSWPSSMPSTPLSLVKSAWLRAEAREEEQRAKMRPKPGDGEGRGAEDGDKIEYREVFRKIVSGVSPGELSAEERAVLKSGHDSDAEFRVQTAGTTTQGGYTVPVTLANFIIKSMVAWGPMYDPGICTEILTTSGEQINIPTIDDTAVTVVRHLAAGEGVALVDDGSKDVVVGTKRLDAYIFDTEFVRWSIELSQDSIHNWEQLLGDLLGERLARRANTELTTGDGSGDPNGIVTASTLGVTAASATGLTADELIDLSTRSIRPIAPRPRPGYMFNDHVQGAPQAQGRRGPLHLGCRRLHQGRGGLAARRFLQRQPGDGLDRDRQQVGALRRFQQVLRPQGRRPDHRRDARALLARPRHRRPDPSRRRARRHRRGQAPRSRPRPDGAGFGPPQPFPIPPKRSALEAMRLAAKETSYAQQQYLRT